MRKKERRSYILTLVFTLVALIFIVAYSFTSFYRNARDNMLALGQSSLAEETEHLDSYLTKGMDVLQVTAITVEYMMQQGATREEIEDFLLSESVRYTEEIDENFTGIYGLFNGEYIDGIGWMPDADYVPWEREWYVAASEAGGRPVVVSPYLDAQTGTIMISVSQLLYDNESVISLDIVLEQIQTITGNISMDNMGYGFIVDRNGLVVAHSDVAERGRNYLEDGENSPLLERIYQANSESFTMDIAGESCTVFTDTVKDDWYVVMVVNNTRLYQDIRDILLQNSIICAVVLGLIMFFCTNAFRKMRLHMDKAEESRKRVESMNVTIMRSLARTIDAKDHYTNGHSQRVAKYALEIAKRMGKDEEEQKVVYYGALLHDVGKIRIPDSIINKASRLTDEEYEFIKLHCTCGYYILRDIKENTGIAQAAKWHHERYDGSGYPNGLAGKDIPEIARIIGVADSYDAMTSNRSYRQIMPQSKVRGEIERGKGTQFDPVIADVMLKLIDEDKAYCLRQTDNNVRNILVVDDEPMNIVLIEFMLKDEPRYHIYAANGGREALDSLDEVKPDLILLDIQMPEMDGFETYRKLREVSNVPIVFLTADKSIETINRANELKVEDYLVKPCMPQALSEILYNILQERVSI